MTTKKICPTCGTVHTVELTHEWKKKGSQLEWSFIQKMDSGNVDGAKLEGLLPRGESDGRVLCVKGEWLDDNQAIFTLWRQPVGGIVPAEALHPRSRADMETEAVEKGIDFNKKTTDTQLAHAIATHKPK